MEQGGVVKYWSYAAIRSEKSRRMLTCSQWKGAIAARSAACNETGCVMSAITPYALRPAALSETLVQWPDLQLVLQVDYLFSSH